MDFIPPETPAVADLLAALTALRADIAQEGRALFNRWRPQIRRRDFAASALNFAHYLALRRRDLRRLQVALMPYGLSSLGRLEGRVLANLDAVIATLQALDGRPVPGYPRPRAYFRGDRRLHINTDDLFGAMGGRSRDVRILVTLPTEAADDLDLAVALLSHGTDAVRINCAHDGPAEWGAMLETLRTAQVLAGRRAKVLMDLAGPKCRTGEVAPPPHRHEIQTGDHLLLRPGRLLADAGGFFQAVCTLPQVIGRLQPGEAVYVDDGRIGGAVVRIDDDGALVRIDRAPPDGIRLRPDKGLNFPDSDLGLLPLTDDDRRDLDFVAQHADMVGYSFVQSAEDIRLLQQELAARRPDDWQRIGVVAKIETPRAVHALPDIIVQAASHQPFAAMIARGDLAVEIGFERLAELQEEILWLCEAAHVPVIWATQVLESLVKRGLPTRGDMTDAAMSARADCVMLNKGPHVVDAVATLDRLLTRMAEHQTKKTPRLRALHSW